MFALSWAPRHIQEVKFNMIFLMIYFKGTMGVINAKQNSSLFEMYFCSVLHKLVFKEMAHAKNFCIVY